jgi:hypothetical protein
MLNPVRGYLRLPGSATTAELQMVNRVAKRHKASEPALPHVLSRGIEGHVVGRGDAGIGYHLQCPQRDAEAFEALAKAGSLMGSGWDGCLGEVGRIVGR